MTLNKWLFLICIIGWPLAFWSVSDDYREPKEWAVQPWTGKAQIVRGENDKLLSRYQVVISEAYDNEIERLYPQEIRLIK